MYDWLYKNVEMVVGKKLSDRSKIQVGSGVV